MQDVICAGCLTRGKRDAGEAMRCFGCDSELVAAVPQRWTITSRAGVLQLWDRTTGAAVLPIPNIAFAGELVRLLNLSDDLRIVMLWMRERAARTLMVADLAAMAWLATLEMDHVPFDQTGILQRFVARAAYLEAVETSGSIMQDVIRPLADREGVLCDLIAALGGADDLAGGVDHG